MKKMLLALLCMPVFAYGQTYSYNKIISAKTGSDNFSFDKQYCENVYGGKIELKDNLLYIDARIYKLKARRIKNQYRSKNCSFELVYDNTLLVVVKQFRQNEVIYYLINKVSTEPASGNTPEYRISQSHL